MPIAMIVFILLAVIGSIIFPITNSSWPIWIAIAIVIGITARLFITKEYDKVLWLILLAVVIGGGIWLKITLPFTECIVDAVFLLIVLAIFAIARG